MTKEELKALGDAEDAIAQAEKPAANAAAASGKVDREKEAWEDMPCPEGIYLELTVRKSSRERSYFGGDHSAFEEGDPCEYSFSLSEAVEKTYNNKTPQQIIALVRLGTLKTQQLVNIETGALKNPKAYMIGINGSTAKSRSTSKPI